MEMQLTTQDINLMLEALEAWEKEAMSAGLLGGILGVIVAKDEEDATSRADARMAEASQEARRRSRSAVLLKAKLITMQDEMAPDQLFSKVKVGEK
jgi:hypothetical protein